MKTIETLIAARQNELFTEEFISALENYAEIEPVFGTFLQAYRENEIRSQKVAEREIRKRKEELKKEQELKEMLEKLKEEAPQIEIVAPAEKPTFEEGFSFFLGLIKDRVAKDGLEYDSTFEGKYKTVFCWFFGIPNEVPNGKHIWLRGATGSGKTTVLQICNRVAKHYGFDCAMTVKAVKNANATSFDATVKGSVIFDDVGAERITDAYNDKGFIAGNRVPDMLADCYEKRNVSKFAVTSNFSISELFENGKGYDDRIISRCKGMFVEIDFPNIDFRQP